MAKRIYNKLVRDKIPAIIQADGYNPYVKILNNQDYLKELVHKLEEEVAEFKADLSIEEMADIKEVLIALREVLGWRAGEVEDVRRRKAASCGRFKKRLFLESVE